MALTKAQKNEILEDLKDKIDRQKSVFFIDFQGLKVKNLSILRRKIKEAGGILKVFKKTFIKLALEKTSLKMGEKLEGEIAVIFSFEDEMLPLKKAYEFSQTNENLKIVAAIFEKKFIGKEETIALAQLPSKEELLGRLVGAISAPISGLLNVLQGNIKGLIYALNAIKNIKINEQ